MPKLSLPKECEATMEHALVHLKQAIESKNSDPEQSLHDADMAMRALYQYVFVTTARSIKEI